MRESRTLEYKESITNTFLKTVSAFANYGSGEIIFGIADDGRIIGIQDPKAACLDIENRKELVQGNIRTDDFMDVWKHGFHVFRRDRTIDCSRCENCSERFLCGGDSTHTWDYEKEEPLFCYRDYQL